MSAASTRDALLALLTPVVTANGLDLEDVEVTPAGKRRLLRIVVDQDGGVGLDRVASVSTAVSAALDASSVMGGTPYVLEVTSPGVDRPLTEQRHWRRARGHLVEAKLADQTVVTARLIDAGEAGVLLGTDGSPRLVAWPDIASGRVQVEFNRPTGTGDSQEED